MGLSPNRAQGAGPQALVLSHFRKGAPTSLVSDTPPRSQQAEQRSYPGRERTIRHVEKLIYPDVVPYHSVARVVAALTAAVIT